MLLGTTDLGELQSRCEDRGAAMKSYSRNRGCVVRPLKIVFGHLDHSNAGYGPARSTYLGRRLLSCAREAGLGLKFLQWRATGNDRVCFNQNKNNPASLGR